MTKHRLILLISILLMSFLSFSCFLKKDDDSSSTSSTPVDIPELTARCKYLIPSSGFCDGTPQGSGGMNTNKGIVYIANSKDEIVAMQLGDLTCGDSGGSLGVHCSMETSQASWVNTNAESVSQLNTGKYTLSFQLDKAGDVSSYLDIENFGTGDTICTAEVTISADTTEIADTDASLFTCVTFP